LDEADVLHVAADELSMEGEVREDAVRQRLDNDSRDAAVWEAVRGSSGLDSAETDAEGGCDAGAKLESAAGWLRAECRENGEGPPAALLSVATAADDARLFPLLLFLLLLLSSPLRFPSESEAEAKAEVRRGWTDRGAAVELRLLWAREKGGGRGDRDRKTVKDGMEAELYCCTDCTDCAECCSCS
jgi:hypothetical protein